MEPYEVTVMIAPEAEEPRQDEIIDRIRQIVEAGGGELEAVDALGRRKLAYEIDKHGEAYYHVVTFRASAETLDEVTRVLRITDDVLRHMAVRRSGRSHGPAAEEAPVS